ncbi:MAG: CRISPR-associated endonuclease Cas2 [Armatimonadota bacterium]
MRSMWVIAMYDLPVDSLEAKRHYRQFRDKLLDDGFFMLQYSVYGRPCPSIENCEVHIGRVEEAVPPEGEVRVFTMTDLQFARMRIFFGRKPKKPEDPPDQLTMF